MVLQYFLRRRVQQWALIAIGLALLTGLFSACSLRHQPPLRVGVFAWPGYLSLDYARHLGLMDDRQVQLIAFDSLEDVMQAFRNRVIDAATITMDEVIRLATHQQEPRIVMVFNISDGADVVMALPDIDGPEALRGKRVALETNTLAAYVLVRMLDHAGLSIDDISVVDMPLRQHAQALREAKVDAVVSYDPWRSQLVEAGAEPIFSSRQIPGEIVDVLVVREEVLKTRESALRHLVQRHFEAMQELQAQPRLAAEVLHTRLSVKPDDLLDAWQMIILADLDMNRRLLQEGKLYPSLQRLQDIMLSAGLLVEPQDVSVLVDARLVRGGG